MFAKGQKSQNCHIPATAVVTGKLCKDYFLLVDRGADNISSLDVFQLTWHPKNSIISVQEAHGEE